MKAISLWQPWASALMLGPAFKHHETRHWETRYRGPLAIHAAKRWTRDEVWALHELMHGGFPLSAATCPRGVILGVAELVECVPTHTRQPSERDRLAGNWSSDRFAWRFEKHILLPEPIPFRGAQGLFDVPDELFAPSPGTEHRTNDQA